MAMIMIITLATVAQISVPRSSLLLRCGDVELNPGPGRYPGNYAGLMCATRLVDWPSMNMMPELPAYKCYTKTRKSLGMRLLLLP